MAEQLQERLDELLVCPICLDQIKNPKTLPCQHSFCFDPCLKDLSRRSDNQQPRVGGSITCPICRKKFRFNHLSSLPDDLTLNNLLEIQRNQPPPTASAPPWEGSTSGASTSTSGLQGSLGQHEQAPLLSRNTDNVPANSKSNRIEQDVARSNRIRQDSSSSNSDFEEIIHQDQAYVSSFFEF